MAITHEVCGARLDSVIKAYVHLLECGRAQTDAPTLALPDRLVPLLGARTNPYHKKSSDLFGGEVRRVES